MTIWNDLKKGIDKAGKAAQDVFDEGKTRIDAYRAREQADKAAEALGYAVFRAMELGADLDSETRDRLMRSMRERDTEARRLEAILSAENAAKPASGAGPAGDGEAPAAAPSGASPTDPPYSGAPGGTPHSGATNAGPSNPVPPTEV